MKLNIDIDTDKCEKRSHSKWPIKSEMNTFNFFPPANQAKVSAAGLDTSSDVGAEHWFRVNFLRGMVINVSSAYPKSL